MRIITENLKPIQKIWNQVRVKGVQMNDYVLLDFENKKLAFQNPSVTVKVDLTLEDNDGKGLNHRSLFVDGGKLFSLIQFYDYIDIDEDDVFYSSLGDKFIVPELNEEVMLGDNEYRDWDTITVNFTPELNKKLSIASTYVDSDPKSDFCTLFVHQGTLIACNRFKMLFAQTDNGLGGVETDIPLALLRLITSLDMQGSVELKTRTSSNDAKIIEFSYGGIWLRYRSSSLFSLPFDPESEDFQSTYNHPTWFCVDLSQLDEAVKFLSSYYSDTVNAVCQCVFETEDPDAMYMVIHLSYEMSGTTDYKVKILSCSDPEYFNGRSAYIYLNYIKAAMGVLSQYEVEQMRITFDEDAPAMAFEDAKEEAPVFVIHTTAEEL